jgi:NADH dehydrogenase
MTTDRKHHVVVIGGGFGGLWTARSLKKADVNITLVDKRNFHLFQPLLYQVATGGLSPGDIASPLRGVLAHQKNASVRLDEMVGVDLEQKEVILKSERLPYDSLVIATGSATHYYGHPEWESRAPGLKSIEDALHIRNRIYAAFEAASNQTDPEQRKRLMTFVIIGGGPTGVELAGALGEIAKITLRDNFRSINPAEARIMIFDGGQDILSEYKPKLRAAARKSLAKLGVTIHNRSLAKDIDDSGVTIQEGENESRVEAGTIIWAAGVKSTATGSMLVSDPSELDRSGRVLVNNDLTLKHHSDTYVIGDLACVTDPKLGLLPGTAPVAMSEGRYVAHSIAAKLKGKPVGRYLYRNKGSMAVIGRAAAIADLGWARFTGYPAWLLWLFIHLMYLVEFDNRLLVLVQWAWSYLTRRRGARLITYDIKSLNHRG